MAGQRGGGRFFGFPAPKNEEPHIFNLRGRKHEEPPIFHLLDQTDEEPPHPLLLSTLPRIAATGSSRLPRDLDLHPDLSFEDRPEDRDRPFAPVMPRPVLLFRLFSPPRRAPLCYEAP